MLKRLKSAAAAGIIICLCCLCGGCSAVQVNERMYVQMLGMSEDEDECVLCVQVCGTKSAPDEPPEYEYYEGRGEGFRQAAADIEQKNGRELFFGHCTLAVLDKNFLCSAEALKMLMGERISPGCRVCCSDDPTALLSRKSDSGGIIGADIISGEIKQYEKRGQFKEVTLKDVCIWAGNSESMFIPAFSGDNFGSGAMKYGSGILYLSPEETALCNLLKEETGAEFPVTDGTVKTDKVKNSAYLQTGENILNISLDMECTLTETGNPGSLSDYEREAANAVTDGILQLLRKSDEAGVLEAVTGVKTENADFNVNVRVKISVGH